MTLTEKLKYRFPKLSHMIDGFMEKKKNSSAADMLLCAGITFTAGIYEFEAFLYPPAAEALRTVVSIVFILSWLWCFFLSGFWKKYSFLLFGAAFWIIPRIMIMWQDSTGIREYSKYLDAAAQFSRILVMFSLHRISEFLNVSVDIAALSIGAWYLFFFWLGLTFCKKRRKARENNKKCLQVGN